MSLKKEWKWRCWYVSVGVICSLYVIFKEREKWYYWLYKLNGEINEVSVIESLEVFVKIVWVIGVVSNSILIWIQWYSMVGSGMSIRESKRERFRFLMIIMWGVLLYVVLIWIIGSIKVLVEGVKAEGVIKIGMLNGLKSNVKWVSELLWNVIIVWIMLYMIRKWEIGVVNVIRKRLWLSMLGLVISTICSSSEVISQLILWLIWQVIIEEKVIKSINEKWYSRYKERFR